MINIAIDGPAGAGKSTVAKALATRLGYIYVDTGALYRTVAVHLIDNKIDETDEKTVSDSLKNITVDMKHFDDGQHVFLGEKDVTDIIRTPEISMIASTASKVPDVRKFLFDLQLDFAKNNNVIMDGRDIGTVVLPNAQVKIFLTASAKERAKRRVLDLKSKGTDVDFETVLKDITDRDYQDANREIAPLKPADDAVYLDTSSLEFDEVVEEILKIIKEKGVSNER